MLLDTIRVFVDRFTLNPRIKSASGLIACRNSHGHSWWQAFQDEDYLFSMIIHRSSEAYLGNVTYLPGALTIVEYSLFKRLSVEYFHQRETDSSYEFCRQKLGEDRYLTHLAMEVLQGWQLGFDCNAICKTDAPKSFYNLLRQRRRWNLGGTTSDIYMITAWGSVKKIFFFGTPFKFQNKFLVSKTIIFFVEIV